jgi:adenylate cyclase
MGACRRALQLDSGNALALGLMAVATIYPVIISQSDNPSDAINQADELASRALAADPNGAAAHLAKAWVMMAQSRHEQAILEAEKSPCPQSQHDRGLHGYWCRQQFSRSPGPVARGD